jgi:hypothetical protein
VIHQNPTYPVSSVDMSDIITSSINTNKDISGEKQLLFADKACGLTLGDFYFWGKIRYPLIFEIKLSAINLIGLNFCSSPYKIIINHYRHQQELYDTWKSAPFYSVSISIILIGFAHCVNVTS